MCIRDRFELVANQIPTIFIPYPYAAGDHQYYNAKFLEEKNAGFVIRQNEITPQKVLNIILNSNLKTVSKNLAKINQKNGAEIIVDKVLNVLSF
jgi:UDP-N-acetylglucosamine--N-acetylmuramyl-(pentapeptide) pyrophosphoryl-undecaprenol N-acetylglucosamine transferase